MGIRAGGRTGLVAVTCGLLMAATAVAGYFFAPALALIPAEAASGVLVYVGYLLLSSSVSSKAYHLTAFDAVVAVSMSAVSFAFFGLDKALALGFWAYFVRGFWPAEGRKPAYWLGIIAAVLTAEILWQKLGGG